MGKKHITLIVMALSALLALTACGGGGGGGGETKAPAPITWVPDPAPLGAGSGATLTNAGAVFSTSGSMDATLHVGSSSIAAIRKTDDGLQIDVISDRKITFSVAAGDFKDTPGDYITAVKTSSGRYTDDNDISYKAQDTVLLGGKKLGLNFSDFGFWATYERARFDDQGPDGGATITGGTGFYMGDSSKRANFATSSGTQTFSGNTIAQAHGGGVSGVDYLTGTAEMTFPSSASDTYLILKLTGFADFDIPVNINSNGAITGRSGSVIVNNVNTSRVLNGIENANVNGQFYGNTPGNPSEAAGSYFMQSGGESYTTINGSFGLKK